jgi:5-oxoprolinase (ATP-hydrolysing)
VNGERVNGERVNGERVNGERVNGERWEFWIDVGGTFTDCVARRPDGELLRCKVLSSAVLKGRGQMQSDQQLVDHARCGDPADFWTGCRLRVIGATGTVLQETRVARFDGPRGQFTLTESLSGCDGKLAYEVCSDDEAPVLAARWILGAAPAQPLPPLVMRLGTTRGTNALLTRRGARTALVTTAGFADILRIGYQNRPRLFDLTIRRPPPLFETAVELDERIDADGTIRRPLHAAHAHDVLRALHQSGIQSVAICLLNAYASDVHEQLAARIARELGFDDVSVSSVVAPLIKLVARGDTTVVNAYLNPILANYIARIQTGLGQNAELRLMTSAGGLVSAECFAGKDSILSGPAGGVVGFSRTAQAAGFSRAIGFDMGGTSTDVSRFDGRWELQYEAQKAGVRLVTPMIAIETVAAGGGSICDFDGVKLTVGPQSAGADPGPACYGRGGPLTVTDLNLFLGRVLETRFPFPLHAAAIGQRLQALIERVDDATGRRYTEWELAEGLLAIANANMAQAIRSISVAKGYDPQEYVLAAFGGAAPQHACAVAGLLSMRRILIHPDAGLLSALGIGVADIVRHCVSAVYRDYDQAVAEMPDVFAGLEAAAIDQVQREGVEQHQISARRFLEVRFRGLEASLTIAEPGDGDFRTAYLGEYERLHGFVPADRRLEIVAARVEATGALRATLPTSERASPGPAPTPTASGAAWFAGQRRETLYFDRSRLLPGHVVAGPAIITEPFSTIVLEPGWQTEVLSHRELLLTQVAQATAPPLTPALVQPGHSDPIALEIFHQQFAAIAEQMGMTLRNTSCSVNVKERLDFSCAVFSASGDLVANAPHIPVHLGAMGETVKAVLNLHPRMSDGDIFVSNDPYQGGSHLPDITVVTPVFAGTPRTLAFFTASRAHHAEIGGITPGSMPPHSRHLAEEGVLIRCFALAHSGSSHWNELRQLLASGPYPSRNVDNNLADIAAQVAANRQGARDLLALSDRFSLPTVLAYTQHIQAAAEQKMRRALRRLAPGTRTFTDYLDDGSPICVTLTIHGDSATIDFRGTGPVLPGNLNANRAIVTAAVMYCFRCLLDEDIPLNQGVLVPLTLHLPTCLLNPPAAASAESCAAVAGGNVETSQRVVDVLLAALNAAAASQGTMNNFTFGDATFGYYETICGGAGATAEGPGASAVHTHMTNTRLTDPEVLEQRFPARVLEFSIRRGSGGAGRHSGGDGIVRRIEFRRDLDVSLVSQRRGPYPPFGLHGGASGAFGRNRLQHPDGSETLLPNITSFPVANGDVLMIETPGGGGFGAPPVDD